jgi:hypothetical protein
MEHDAGSDWTDDVADRIEQAVANLRERAVEPVLRVARAVVFGTLAIGFAVPAAVIALVVAFRALVIAFNALPGPDDNAWMAWTLLGLVLVGGGMRLFISRDAGVAASAGGTAR